MIRAQTLDSVGRVPRRKSALRPFSDGGGVEQRGNDRRRSDPDRNAGLHQLGPAFLLALVGIAHSVLLMVLSARPYAEERGLEREVRCGVA